MARLEHEVLRADEAQARLERNLLRPVLAFVAGVVLMLAALLVLAA